VMGVHSASDAFTANNVMQQKGSFHHHEGGDGSAQTDSGPFGSLRAVCVW